MIQAVGNSEVQNNFNVLTVMRNTVTESQRLSTLRLKHLLESRQSIQLLTRAPLH